MVWAPGPRGPGVLGRTAWWHSATETGGEGGSRSPELRLGIGELAGATPCETRPPVAGTNSTGVAGQFRAPAFRLGEPLPGTTPAETRRAVRTGIIPADAVEPSGWPEDAQQIQIRKIATSCINILK